MSTIAYDDFVGTGGTFLQNHTPDSGGPWVDHYGSGYYLQLTNGTGRVRPQGSFADSIAHFTGDLGSASADYDVEVPFYIATTSYTLCSVWGRFANDGYMTRYGAFFVSNGSAATLTLQKVGNFNSGIPVTLGTYSMGTPSAGTTQTVKLSMSGTTIKVYLNGTERISVTDSAITAKGYGALYMSASSPSDSVGAQAESFTMTGTLAATPAHISGSSSASASGSLTLSVPTPQYISGSSSAAATGTLALGIRATLGSLASTATAEGYLSLATSSAVGVRAAPGWLGLFITDTGGSPIPTISGASNAVATGSLSVITPSRVLIAGSSNATAIGSLLLRAGPTRAIIIRETYVTSPQFGTKTVSSDTFGDRGTYIHPESEIS